MHLVRVTPRVPLPHARRAWPFVLLLLICLWVAVRAQAQPLDDDARVLLDKARQAFLHVEVRGTPLDPTNPLQESERFGKAFAISPDMLVTTMHVVGDEAEWKLARNTRDEITRAVRPLDRTVEVTGANGGQVPLRDIIVLPAATHAIDAAAIFVPGLDLDSYYQHSLCDIREGEIYAALMTDAADPADRRSVDSPTLVHLRASGHRPGEYGGLYVFVPEDAPGFSAEPWGHGGSPIFDADGNVAALISAVTATSEGIRILATPIQPLFPGTNQILARGPDTSTASRAQLKCSMLDMVARIHDQVASHAIWTVSAEMEDGRASGDILFEYESVADPPNIASIEVRYQFWGTEKEGDELTRIAHRPSNEDVVVLTPGRLLRSFATSEIVRVGRRLVEPFISQGGGSIRFLRLTITPTLTTGQTLESRRKVHEVQWSDFQ